MAQCLVNDVANGMDIRYCIDEIMFSRAHEETDPVSAFPGIFALARIPAGDVRETCDRSTDSAGFVATGILGLADVMDIFRLVVVMEVLPIIPFWMLISSQRRATTLISVSEGSYL
jgi:hypothetical protein